MVEFKSGKITWKLKPKSFLYNIWEGFYKNQHLFDIKQTQNFFELTLVQKSNTSKSFTEMQKKAELILESFNDKK